MANSSITRVRKGDIIVERSNGKNRMTPVRKVDFLSCSSYGVHINDKDCYEYSAVVQLVDGEGTLGDLRDEVELGTVRVSDDGVNEEDLDAVMDNIMSIADQLVRP